MRFVYNNKKTVSISKYNVPVYSRLLLDLDSANRGIVFETIDRFLDAMMFYPNSLPVYFHSVTDWSIPELTNKFKPKLLVHFWL